MEVRNPYDTQKVVISFDFSTLKKIPCTVDLDAGAASYWSEIAAMQTLDNLLMQGKISTVEYLKRLPSGQITDRETLIATMEREQQMQMAAMGMASGGNSGGTPLSPGNDPTPPLRGGAGYGALQRKINESGEVPREEGNE